MPESVRDRPTQSYEHVFLLAKSKRYYYDNVAVRETGAESSKERAKYPWRGRTDDGSGGARTGSTFKRMAESGEPIGTITGDGTRNLRSVWAIGTKGTKLAHYASFPAALVEPMVLAGSSERGACPECGSPWERITERTNESTWQMRKAGGATGGCMERGARQQQALTGSGVTSYLPPRLSITTGWRPTCAHYPLTDAWVEYPRQQDDETDDHYQERIAPVRALRAELLALWEPETTVPCVVLDPFSGTATVGEVCQKHGRRFVGIDLKYEYCQMGRERLGLDKLAAWGGRAAEGDGAPLVELPLFATVAEGVLCAVD